MKLAAWRHILIAIEQELLRNSSQNVLENRSFSANTLMAGHSINVEEHFYAITPDDLAGANNRMIAAFYQVSRQWHALWDMITIESR